MKNKKLILGITIVFILLIGITTIIISQRSQKEQKPQSEEKQIEKQPTPKAKDTPSINDKLRALPRPSWFTERQWEITLNATKEGIASNHPIDFFGKVVDQFDEPVDSALVKISVTRFNEGILSNMKARPDLTTAYELMTGMDGIFHLTGCNGYSFEIKDVIKERYRKLPDGPRYYYSNNWGKESFNFDPNKPEIIKILNEAQTEPLYKNCVQREKIKIGEEYYINFGKRNVQNSQFENADIKIKVEVGEMRGSNPKKFDWSYSIEILNGGIIEMPSYTYTAPESGYKNKIAFSTGKLPQLLDTVDKVYFLHDNRTDIYALLKFHLYAYNKEIASLSWEYFVNPKPGSRNLSYDSLKALRKWPEK